LKKSIDNDAINPIHGNINYFPDLVVIAKRNRRKPTLAEDIIWQKLLRYQKMGYKFTRQKPINRFILDFYCSELNLAIEIDGDSHIKKKSNDELRDKFLFQIGITTIRFSNEEIINNLEGVRNKLTKYFSASPVKGRSQRGRG